MHLDKNVPNDYLDDLKQYAEITKQEIKKSTDLHKIELDKKFSQDLELKKRLSEFAKDHALDLALIAVWEDMQYYSSQSKKDNFDNVLNVGEICESEEECKESYQNKIKKISFKWANADFDLTYYQRTYGGWFPGEEVEYHALFELFEGGELVFKIEAKIDDSYYCKSFEDASISAFKKKGVWAKFLIDSWKTIQITKKKLMVDINYYKADDIKDNFQD